MGYRYQNKHLPMDKPFTDKDGNKYPANWLRLSTQADKDKIAITWVPDYCPTCKQMTCNH